MQSCRCMNEIHHDKVLMWLLLTKKMSAAVKTELLISLIMNRSTCIFAQYMALIECIDKANMHLCIHFQDKNPIHLSLTASYFVASLLPLQTNYASGYNSFLIKPSFAYQFQRKNIYNIS